MINREANSYSGLALEEHICFARRQQCLSAPRVDRVGRQCEAAVWRRSIRLSVSLALHVALHAAYCSFVPRDPTGQLPQHTNSRRGGVT